MVRREEEIDIKHHEEERQLLDISLRPPKLPWTQDVFRVFALPEVSTDASP